MAKPLTSCDMEIRVRYDEVDRMGAVHHSRYWVYFEMGRIEMLRRQGVSYRDVEDAGVYLVVVRGSVRFRAPARYDDVLVLTTKLEKLGQVKIEHSYELRRKDDGVLIATAETTLGCVDRESNVRPLPPSVTYRDP